MWIRIQLDPHSFVNFFVPDPDPHSLNLVDPDRDLDPQTIKPDPHPW